MEEELVYVSTYTTKFDLYGYLLVERIWQECTVYHRMDCCLNHLNCLFYLINYYVILESSTHRRKQNYSLLLKKFDDTYYIKIKINRLTFSENWAIYEFFTKFRHKSSFFYSKWKQITKNTNKQLQETKFL